MLLDTQRFVDALCQTESALCHLDLSPSSVEFDVCEHTSAPMTDASL